MLVSFTRFSSEYFGEKQQEVHPSTLRLFPFILLPSFSNRFPCEYFDDKQQQTYPSTFLCFLPPASPANILKTNNNKYTLLILCCSLPPASLFFYSSCWCYLLRFTPLLFSFSFFFTVFLDAFHWIFWTSQLISASKNHLLTLDNSIYALRNIRKKSSKNASNAGQRLMK